MSYTKMASNKYQVQDPTRYASRDSSKDKYVYVPKDSGKNESHNEEKQVEKNKDDKTK